MTASMVFFEPVDVWSFRDGRPFDVGEAFDAASVFPPSPWTTLGSIRTCLLRGNCPDPESYAGRRDRAGCAACSGGLCQAEPVVGKPGEAPPFQLGPPLPARRRTDGTVDLYYPAPADLAVLAPDTGPCEPVMLKPLDVRGTARHSLHGLAPIGVGRRGRIQPVSSPWVSASDLTSALAGHAVIPAKQVEFVGDEPRIGIGIDSDRNSARHGQIYTRETKRLRDGWGLAVHQDRRLGLNGEMARLGGDGRLARLSDVEAADTPARPELTGTRFKVYLASPAWFGRGDRPMFLASGDGVWPGTATHVRLVGAALTASVSVGGWDLQRQQPRPMRRLVGAGSVYFFEVVEGTAMVIAATLHGRAWLDHELDSDFMARAGFGLAFVGRW